MPKIIWKGIIRGEEEFPTAPLPGNAKRLETEEDLAKMQRRALPFLLPPLFLCFACMFWKTRLAREMVLRPLFLFPGVVAGLLLLPVHEWLHAVAFPQGATVYIGVMPRSLSPVALSSSPVRRERYILLSILPVVLGLLPLGLFLFSPVGQKAWNGVLLGMAILGMSSVYPDLYNIFHIWKSVPRGATIQNSGSATYYY